MPLADPLENAKSLVVEVALGSPAPISAADSTVKSLVPPSTTLEQGALANDHLLKNGSNMFDRSPRTLPHDSEIQSGCEGTPVLLKTDAFAPVVPTVVIANMRFVSRTGGEYSTSASTVRRVLVRLKKKPSEIKPQPENSGVTSPLTTLVAVKERVISNIAVVRPQLPVNASSKRSATGELVELGHPSAVGLEYNSPPFLDVDEAQTELNSHLEIRSCVHSNEPPVSPGIELYAGPNGQNDTTCGLGFGYLPAIGRSATPQVPSDDSGVPDDFLASGKTRAADEDQIEEHITCVEGLQNTSQIEMSADSATVATDSVGCDGKVLPRQAVDDFSAIATEFAVTSKVDEAYCQNTESLNDELPPSATVQVNITKAVMPTSTMIQKPEAPLSPDALPNEDFRVPGTGANPNVNPSKAVNSEILPENIVATTTNVDSVTPESVLEGLELNPIQSIHTSICEAISSEGTPQTTPLDTSAASQPCDESCAKHPPTFRFIRKSVMTRLVLLKITRATSRIVMRSASSASTTTLAPSIQRSSSSMASDNSDGVLSDACDDTSCHESSSSTLVVAAGSRRTVVAAAADTATSEMLKQVSQLHRTIPDMVSLDASAAALRTNAKPVAQRLHRRWAAIAVLATAAVRDTALVAFLAFSAWRACGGAVVALVYAVRDGFDLLWAGNALVAVAAGTALYTVATERMMVSA
ncbi:hypothetical protein HK405_003373 [Cladochytrium tenue]|nr:hypothetical protein HK405_003373 [Cladochytrium tenue]